MNRKEWMFLGASLVLAYAVFFAAVPLVSTAVNNVFYGGEPLYRITWSHYFLPLVGAVGTYLLIRWMRDSLGWPRKMGDYVIFLAAAALVLFLAFALGVRAYFYTFVLYGARSLSLSQLWNYLLFTPFWALAPGVFAGWLGAFLAYYKQ